MFTFTSSSPEASGGPGILMAGSTPVQSAGLWAGTGLLPEWSWGSPGPAHPCSVPALGCRGAPGCRHPKPGPGGARRPRTKAQRLRTQHGPKVQGPAAAAVAAGGNRRELSAGRATRAPSCSQGKPLRYIGATGKVGCSEAQTQPLPADGNARCTPPSWAGETGGLDPPQDPLGAHGPLSGHRLRRRPRRHPHPGSQRLVLPTS